MATTPTTRLLMCVIIIALHLQRQVQGPSVKGFGDDEQTNSDAAQIETGDSYQVLRFDLNTEVHDESRIEVHGQNGAPIRKKDRVAQAIKFDTDILFLVFLGIILCMFGCLLCIHLCISEGKCTRRVAQFIFFPLTFLISLMCSGGQREEPVDGQQGSAVPVKVGSGQGGIAGWLKGIFRSGGQVRVMEPIQCQAPPPPRQAVEGSSIHVASSPSIVTTVSPVISPDCRMYPSIIVSTDGQAVAAHDPWEFAQESEGDE